MARSVSACKSEICAAEFSVAGSAPQATMSSIMVSIIARKLDLISAYSKVAPADYSRDRIPGASEQYVPALPGVHALEMSGP